MVLFTCRAAIAQDYRVDYAIEMRAGQDIGSIECRFDRLCIAYVDSLRLRFDVSIHRHLEDRAWLHMDGEAGCCLFEGAVQRLEMKPPEEALRLRLFVGQPARGLEFIENEYVGNLYLKFQFH